TLQYVLDKTSGNVLKRLAISLFIAFLIMMFVPWTQNIRSAGVLTTLTPDQRPQLVESVIAGRIEIWYVRDGDFVTAGDTLVFLSEIKDAYMDSELLARTQSQLEAKRETAKSYESKVKALESQIKALSNNLEFSLKQARNKVTQAKLSIQSDSMEVATTQLQMKIAQEQLDRQEDLYSQGLKSLTELEARRVKWQESREKLIAAENELLSSRNELLNAQVELSSIRAKFQESIAKTQAEKYATLSQLFDSQAAITKMENDLANYTKRSSFYYITSPQTGYVTRTMQTGIGESIEAGDAVMTVVPTGWDLAVEMYVRPVDLPLVQKGQAVRIQFDGWPAIIFSGWPGTSYGTYGGTVFAVDNVISPNGKYRVLVAPDESDHPWPDALRVGSGTSCLLLLNDVLLGYELWRQINGFPPDFYEQFPQPEKTKQMKK
ncbi:MAG: HlyD family efflux transporter periplasmic adaptor subunit, partial [Flavobacteriales bacterium]|nr:HlyD family efflux transporter periplasmic adaptor subunit [Flavobacteriales bacterium]